MLHLKTKTQVRAFLGLTGYYRCFIPNLSYLATSLTDMTRKGQPEKIQWTPAAEKAFQRVKGALTSAPVLRAPEFSCPFLLQTDASDTGLGAILSQIQEGEEHPLIYISRKLTPAGVWRVFRSFISVALETSEEHLPILITGWSVPAAAHHEVAT